MSIDKLKGQFIQGDVQKSKKRTVSGNHAFVHFDNPVGYDKYRINGYVLPKKGAL